MSSLTAYQSAVALKSAGESSDCLIHRPVLPWYHFVVLDGFLVLHFFLCWTRDRMQLSAKTLFMRISSPCLKINYSLVICLERTKRLEWLRYDHLLFLAAYVLQTHTSCKGAQFFLGKTGRIFSGAKIQLSTSTFSLQWGNTETKWLPDWKEL